MYQTVFSIGHSTLQYEQFRALLLRSDVNAVADVRSAPYSRHCPHFNRDALRSELKADRIAYVFLGSELGGRPSSRVLFTNGVADYEKMAATSDFQRGLQRVMEGAQTYRVALMCSEQDPLDCHRCLLVGRALKARGFRVEHILPSGETQSQTQIEDILRKEIGGALNQTDFFQSPSDVLSQAYRRRANRVAYSDQWPNETRRSSSA